MKKNRLYLAEERYIIEYEIYALLVGAEIRKNQRSIFRGRNVLELYCTDSQAATYEQLLLDNGLWVDDLEANLQRKGFCYAESVGHRKDIIWEYLTSRDVVVDLNGYRFKI